MYSLLVVDDEEYAVQALLKGFDWRKLGFDRVYGALDAGEAKDIMLAHGIDLLLCDIEMPEIDGFGLVEWVNERQPNTRTMFITGHADFQFAQQAVRLGAMDYVLKPVKDGQVIQAMGKAVEAMNREKEFRRMYDRQEQLWTIQKPHLVERFWNEILSGGQGMDREALRRTLDLYQLSYDLTMQVCPVLISVENWSREWSARDEAIMMYAIRKSAEDILFPDGNGCMVSDKSGCLFAFVYMGDAQLRGSVEAGPLDSEGAGMRKSEDGQVRNSENRELWDSGRLEARCRDYIEACARYFYCTVSCYLGGPAEILQLPDMCERLAEMEQANVWDTKTVHVWRRGQGPAPLQTAAEPIDWAKFAMLLELGLKEEALARTRAIFDSFEQSRVSGESLQAFYHSLVHCLFQIAQRRNWSIDELTRGAKWQDAQAATRSLESLRIWAERMVTAAADYVREARDGKSLLADQVKSYILSNLQQASREAIARHVHLNPGYLSRVFKKETGESLIDFIIRTKMDHAKFRLVHSEDPVGEICFELGYDNFSYFSKAFKKHVGLSPQEYRKQFGEHAGPQP